MFATINNLTSAIKTAEEFWSSNLMGDIKSAVIYGNTCKYRANELGRKNHEWSKKNLRAHTTSPHMNSSGEMAICWPDSYLMRT